MNANELADELDKYKGIATRDAATMLRQQQYEIENLKLKELTNEEISSIRDEFLSPSGCDIYTFAKAILKKAQNK